jgi:hypothetical protein
MARPEGSSLRTRRSTGRSGTASAAGASSCPTERERRAPSLRSNPPRRHRRRRSHCPDPCARAWRLPGTTTRRLCASQARARCRRRCRTPAPASALSDKPALLECVLPCGPPGKVTVLRWRPHDWGSSPPRARRRRERREADPRAATSVRSDAGVIVTRGGQPGSHPANLAFSWQRPSGDTGGGGATAGGAKMCATPSVPSPSRPVGGDDLA